MSVFRSSLFSGGASYVMSEDSYRTYILNGSYLTLNSSSLGYSDNTQFCTTFDAMDEAIVNSGGDLRALENELGLETGSLGNGTIYRVDILDPVEYNIRAATGEEAGANCYLNTPVDENGNLPEIVFVRNSDGTIKTEDGYAVIDDSESGTKKAELEKLKGPYKTSSGIVHKADLTGYDYTTSSGLPEGVTDNIDNDYDSVLHTKITGWGDGEESSLIYVEDDLAYDSDVMELPSMDSPLLSEEDMEELDAYLDEVMQEHADSIDSMLDDEEYWQEYEDLSEGEEIPSVSVETSVDVDIEQNVEVTIEETEESTKVEVNIETTTTITTETEVEIS